jgi:multimeric flavodoxin WrbA/nitrite reductase/ring-hydroxylating ferredoxin subunit
VSEALPDWIDVGAAAELAAQPLQQVLLGGRVRIALSCVDGVFSAISGVCNHVGGPLGQGRLEGDYVVCPWHYWKFHRATGKGEPGYEADCVPAHEVKVEGGRVLVASKPCSARHKTKHAPHPLAREVVREAGPVRVLGISTTAMTEGNPRYSTSDDLLDAALAGARELGCDTQLIRMRDLAFRACEGFYSKSSKACTWPCSITQLDPRDQMDRVYEGVVHWADVIVVSTPIRWGNASSLYYKMVERMNCIQNQETIADRHLMKHKVAGFIITGGQDNIQAVAGQMMGFFGEIGCQFPQFPYIAHSRGWSAEDMENNQRFVQRSEFLHEGARSLVGRCVEMSKLMLGGQITSVPPARGGRKAHDIGAVAAAAAPSGGSGAVRIHEGP